VRFVVLTLFPEFFESPLAVGLLGKAVEGGAVKVETVQIRDFATDAHRSVDDVPFGGGPGMVMMPNVVVDAIEQTAARRKVDRKVLLAPRGRLFTQAVARDLARLDSVMLVCGRYEGVDERVVEGGFVDEELSIGDFVLSGGEAAALVVVEACSRYLGGVVGNEESVEADSFTTGLLDHPHYTRPRQFRGLNVPEVLCSGRHAQVREWRRRKALEATRKRRPDLFSRLALSEEDRRLLEP
jgi:tRNA (guanine37-N1)-methyltransferase